MNKTELLKLIDSLGLNKDEFYVVSSGALVLRNLLPKANDLDIAVSKSALEKLKAKYQVKPKPNNEDWFIVSDKVECVLKDMSSLPFHPELAENVPVQNIMEYYEYLLTSEREKDKARITIVKKYIEDNK